MKIPRSSILVLAGLFLSCLHAEAAETSLTIRTSGAQPIYKYGGIETKRLDALLDGLRKGLDEQRLAEPIYVIAHDSVAVRDLQNVRAVLQKIGFKDIHTFVHGDEPMRMLELPLHGRVVPYSTEPKDISKSLGDAAAKPGCC